MQRRLHLNELTIVPAEVNVDAGTARLEITPEPQE